MTRGETRPQEVVPCEHLRADGRGEREGQV